MLIYGVYLRWYSGMTKITNLVRISPDASWWGMELNHALLAIGIGLVLLWLRRWGILTGLIIAALLFIALEVK